MSITTPITAQTLSDLFTQHHGLMVVATPTLDGSNMQGAVVVLFPPEVGQGIMGVNIADALPDDLAKLFTNDHFFPSLPQNILWGGPNGDAGILGSNNFAAPIVLMPPSEATETAPDSLLQPINAQCHALTHPDAWQQVTSWRTRYLVDRGVMALGYTAWDMDDLGAEIAAGYWDLKAFSPEIAYDTPADARHKAASNLPSISL